MNQRISRFLTIRPGSGNRSCEGLGMIILETGVLELTGSLAGFCSSLFKFVENTTLEINWQKKRMIVDISNTMILSQQNNL